MIILTYLVTASKGEVAACYTWMQKAFLNVSEY